MTTTSQSELNIPKSPTGHRISKSMDSRQLTRSINGQEEEEDDQPSELPIVTQSGDFIKNRTNSDPGFVLVSFNPQIFFSYTCLHKLLIFV